MRARPVLSAATRVVLWLYEHGLGGVLGRRFLLLHHTGRRSGRAYTTPLEIVGRTVSGAPIVVAGFGDADWLRNLTAGGPAAATVGRRRTPVAARRLGIPEAADALAAYERRHGPAAPLVRRLLSALLGWRYRGGAADRLRAAEQLPMVALEPG
ncbi:deazaflavin-dependent oxidoreductase, nitroreductase family [Pseudonocardia thermophila]|uniref:Deazaflavin-dependent oxidoreductase, nitroreductase family n=1 Tax=Pseudonocardia thermophila TaxID=1848 RepID=A0A1M6R8K6_PSETH|nr:deazaflavin-dependent oxidoreductase, nitroreductase family [Pseudonocardia thermophila]